MQQVLSLLLREVSVQEEGSGSGGFEEPLSSRTRITTLKFKLLACFAEPALGLIVALV